MEFTKSLAPQLGAKYFYICFYRILYRVFRRAQHSIKSTKQISYFVFSFQFWMKNRDDCAALIRNSRVVLGGDVSLPVQSKIDT